MSKKYLCLHLHYCPASCARSSQCDGPAAAGGLAAGPGCGPPPARPGRPPAASPRPRPPASVPQPHLGPRPPPHTQLRGSAGRRGGAWSSSGPGLGTPGALLLARGSRAGAVGARARHAAHAHPAAEGAHAGGDRAPGRLSQNVITGPRTAFYRNKFETWIDLESRSF